MAYIVSITNSVVNGTPNTVAFPTHAVGDLLLLFCTNDGGGTAIDINSGAGWAMLGGTGAQAASAGCRSAWAWKIAAGTSGEDPSIKGASDDWCYTAYVIRDAHASPFGASPASGTDYVRTDYDFTTVKGSAASGALNTGAEANCLLLYAWGLDSASSTAGNDGLKPNTNDMTVDTYLLGTGIYHMTGHVQMGTAGAAPTVTCYSTLQDGGNGWVIAIRNVANGKLQRDCRSGANVIKWYGNFGTTLETLVYNAPSSFSGDTIDGLALSVGSATITHTTSEPANAPGFATKVSTADSTAGAWCGFSHAIAPPDLTGTVLEIQWALSSTSSPTGTKGIIVALSDGTNWVAYKLINDPVAMGLAGFTVSQMYKSQIALGAATEYASSVTEVGASGNPINLAAVTGFAFLLHRIGSVTTPKDLNIRNLMYLDTAKLIGGNSLVPVQLSYLTNVMTGNFLNGIHTLQGTGQVLPKGKVQIGDGSTPTYFKLAAQSMEYPSAYSLTDINKFVWNAPASSMGVTIYAATGDTIDCSAGIFATTLAQPFTIHASSATKANATYSFAGTSFVGWTVTDNVGLDWNSVTFQSGGTITLAGGADMDACSISKTTSSTAPLTITANGTTIADTTIDCVMSTGANSAYHIALSDAVTSLTLNGVTLSDSPGTTKIYSALTSGTLTITADGTGTALAAGDVTFAAGTATAEVVLPVVSLTITDLDAGSQVKVFATGTTTERFTTSSSGTSEVYSPATAETVDYTVMKAGLLPIRVTGLVIGTTSLSVSAAQTTDPDYVASSGLTWGSNATADATSSPKQLKVNVSTTGRNLHSFLIESWIAESACKNLQFLEQMDGPNSMILINDWETRGYSTAGTATANTTLGYIKQCGIKYLSAAGALKAAWCSLLSSGVPAGKQVRYQQADGSGTTNAAATGDINQTIQIYGNASYGNFDVSGLLGNNSYLVAKVQAEGYDQGEADVVALYGQLGAYLYVIGLIPTLNGIATGDPALTLVIDQGTYTEDAKTFSVRIKSDDSGTDILRELRYNFAAGGTYHGEDAFNWHDLVQTNGSAFKTVRGTVYGTATTKGVIVYQADGTTLHPDFTLFSADADGVTYEPVIPNAATATVLANTRVQLYNVTQDAEIDNVLVAGTAYSYTITTEADAGDVLRLRVCCKGRLSDEASGIWAAAPLAFLVSQPEDTIYTAWGIDGAAVTEYSLDGPNLQIDANDVDGATLKTRVGAFYSYALTTEIGIRQFFGAVTFLSTAAIRVNTAVADLYIDNVNSSTALRFTDLDVRLYKDDGTSIIATTSYSIHNDYSGVPDTVETGVSGLTGAESAQLMGLTNAPTAATVASAVATQSQSTPFHSKVVQINNTTLAGSGTPADPMRPA